MKISLKNYPEESTASSIELVPEAELDGFIENYWVSEQPIEIPHTFDIDIQQLMSISLLIGVWTWILCALSIGI